MAKTYKVVFARPWIGEHYEAQYDDKGEAIPDAGRIVVTRGIPGKVTEITGVQYNQIRVDRDATSPFTFADADDAEAVKRLRDSIGWDGEEATAVDTPQASRYGQSAPQVSSPDASSVAVSAAL